VTAGGPRIAPLPSEVWSEDAIAALRDAFGNEAADALLASGPDARRVPNVLTTLMRHPGLAGPFLVYNNVLLRTPVLEPRWRELMVLRVAWRTRSSYEWLQHVRIAQSCGITSDEIEAIARGADAGVWAPLEADLLAATDQLLDDYRIDDDTWTRLAERLDERQLIEVAFTVGTYTCLAMAFNSFGLELDPDLHTVTAPPLPEEPASRKPR
jgi:4-carboxymuconolactone decarboxylase